MSGSAEPDVSLLAQGENIFLPSLGARGTRASAGQQYSPGSSHVVSSPEADSKVNALVSRRSGNSRNLFSSQLGDLSKTLTFSRDAASAVGVDPITTYADVVGQEGSRGLFSCRDIKGLRRQRFRGIGTIGRHDMRGSPKRHLLCDLKATFEPGQKESRKIKVLLDLPKELEDPPKRNYESEVLTGAKPVYQSGSTGSTILLNNNRVYKKVLQTTYPQPPEEFRLDKTVEPPSLHQAPVHFQQGHHRWVDFPKLVEAPEAQECRSITSSAHLTSQMELSDRESSSATTLSSFPDKQEFFNIMREWRSGWKQHVSMSEVSSDAELLQDLQSVNHQSQMAAIAVVSVLAENQAVQALKTVSTSLFATFDHPPAWVRRTVSSELVAALEKLLEDDEMHVQVPCAITLYSMDKQTEKAEHVLHAVVCESGLERGQLERWCATQCLVCAGVVSAPVISQLLCHLLDSHSPREQTRASRLLAMASKKTNLVHSMVADQLNNSGWQERLASCKVLPLLHDKINKDMCTKLLQLAWEDWSPEVQLGAAIALGKTAHGKMIHDDIVMRLGHDSVLVRLDAIRKLHSLELMTSKLLPVFLKCFKDCHLSIRMEAVSLAGTLALKHPYVLRALKNQLQDNSWKLRALTLRALAAVGECDAELTERLMWIVRFDNRADVRGEACKTIARLGLRKEKVVAALQELTTVEEDEGVVRAALATLADLGHTEKVQDRMLQSVCEAVRQLGTKQAILNDLMAAETVAMTDYGMNRPNNKLAVRDYLDHKQRSRVYSGVRKKREVSELTGGGVNGVKTQRTRPLSSRDWSPNREAISNLLDKVRKRVQSLS